MGFSSHWGLVMTPGQEVNGENLRIFFFYLLINKGMLHVLDEAILMSKYNSMIK